MNHRTFLVAVPAVLTLLVPGLLAGPAFAHNPAEVHRALGAMEVTQSIQTSPQQGLASSVPLTAHKPTTIRAYIEGTRLIHVVFGHLPDFTPISVDGTLTIRQGASIIATLPATNGPISVIPWTSANPATANSSLNFDWDFPPSGTVSLELDITTSPASITATDPPAQSATFVHNQRLRVEGVRLQFDHDNNPATPPTKTPDPALVANGLDWFRKSGPMAPCKIQYWVNPTPLQWTSDLSSTADPGGVLRSTLAGMRVQGSTTYDQAYGWWQGGVSGNGNSSLPGGCASPIGRGAYGNTDPVRHQRTFTHELYHNYHQVHYADGAPDVNWACDAHPGLDTSNGQLGLVGWDTSTGTSLPSTKLDVMVPGQVTSAAWQDAARYSLMWNKWDDPGPEPFFDTCHFNWWQLFPLETFLPFGPLLATEENLPDVDFILVTGGIDPSRLGKLHPAWRLKRPIPPDPPEAFREGDFAVRLIGLQGQVVDERRFFADFDDPDGKAPTDYAFAMNLATPLGATGALDLSEIRLMDLASGALLASMRVSRSLPAVQILSPDPRQMPVLGQPFEIRWSAADADGGPLVYAVQYSPDNGQHYLALTNNLTQPSYIGDPNVLPGGSQVLIRVQASDGFNVGETVAGPFQVPRKTPQVFIHSPESLPGPPDIPVYAECRGLILVGSGTSPDDGALPGDMLEWSDNIQGPLGHGYLPPGPCLRAGPHVITLTGTDKAGRQATAQVQVNVVPAGMDSDADGTPDYADRCMGQPGPIQNDGCPYAPDALPLDVSVQVRPPAGNPGGTFTSFFDVFYDVTIANPRSVDAMIETLHVSVVDPDGSVGMMDLPLQTLLGAGKSQTFTYSFFDVFHPPNPFVYGDYAAVFEPLAGPNNPLGHGGAGFQVVPSLASRCKPIQIGGPLGWAVKAPMPDGREGAAGVIIGDKIFVTHGENGAFPDTSTNYVYDIPSNTWGIAAPALLRRAELTGVCIETRDGRTKLFAVGGRNQASGMVLDNVEFYDPAANVWAAGPPMPTPRRGLGAAFVPGPGVAGGTLGNVYVVGGSDSLGPRSGTPLDANEAFDVDMGVWVRRAPMLRPMMDVYSTTYFPGTGKIYVIGGYNGIAEDRAVQIYDPAIDSWSPGASMPTPRSNLVSGICGTRIYAIGGFDGVNLLSLNEAYDPFTNTWFSPQPPKPTAVAEISSQFVYTGTDIFAIAGVRPISPPSAANEVFTCGEPPPFCHSDADCDDGAFCNGRETCLATTGACQKGTPPICDDQNACTADRCDPGQDACRNVPLADSETANGLDGLCGTADDNPQLNGPDGVCGTADDGHGDGVCDPIDNCPFRFNPSQADGDGDGLGDDCDCAPNAPGTPVPGPVGNTLALTHAPATGITTLNWGAIAIATEYNTYRGTIPRTMMGSRPAPYDHGCFEKDDAQQNGATTAMDGSAPPLGTALYYDNTGQTGCGEGPLGQASSGETRPKLAPCSPGPGTSVETPPHIDPPEDLAKVPCIGNPDILPAGVMAHLPAFEGDTIFLSFPIAIQDVQTADEVRQKFILPTLQAMGTCFGRGDQVLNPPGPPEGIPQPRADFSGLAQDVDFEYMNYPALLRPKTQKMIDVFLGKIPPDLEIDMALEMGEGMTFSQFVAGIERLEIIYPFQQLEAGVPIEHTLLLASRWEGQAVTSVRGALLNRYFVGNMVAIPPMNAGAAGISALRATPGVAAVLSQRAEDGPFLVLLPYGTDRQGIVQLRYAYRMILNGMSVGLADGPFLLWLDAETGQILEMTPLFSDVSASGEVYKRDPGLGTTLQSFQVDPAAGGLYTLKLAGVMNRVDYRGDGFNASDVSISDSTGGSSGTFANFNQLPINNEAQALCASGTNKAFQQVDFFASIYRYRQTVLSNGIFTPFPASVWNPKVEVKRCVGGSNGGGFCSTNADCPGSTCGNWCNANASMSYGACAGYFDAGCPNVPGEFTNFAHDNTVVAHELAHSITPRLTNARPSNWCCTPFCFLPCAMPLGWGKFHDLADFWADHFENTNCTAGWVGKNIGGPVNHSLNCSPGNSESGYLPRLHEVSVPFNPGDAGDHFPEHRGPGTSSCSYDDGQIGAAALWQVRLGMRSKCRPSGVPQFGVRYQRAMKHTGFFGAAPACSDLGIYRHLYDLETEMLDQWATSGSPGGPPAFAHNGPHTSSKVTAGFARTGVFLVPYNCLDGGAPCLSGENGADAVIDIDDNDLADDLTLNGVYMPEVDFLELGGPAPIFQVWTGPRYRLDGVGGDATFSNPAPCNAKFKVEVSTDPTFPAPIIDSPWIDVDRDPTTAASPECYGTWTPNAGKWNQLQAGGALSRVYYRVRTRDASDGNERISTMPGNGLWTVPPPYAVLTTDGQSDY